MVFRQVFHSLFPHRSQSVRRRRSSGKPNRTEHLEQRTLLTGNVQVQLVGASGFITGDSGDNSVEVVADGSTLVVRGLDGTTINGTSDVFTLSASSTSLSGGLVASLGAGNDRLTIGRDVSISGSVWLYGGAGDDSIGVVGSMLGGNLTVASGDGSDTISLQDSSVVGSIFIYSAGKATINVSNSTIGGWFHVHTGSGADNIVLDGSTVNGWTQFDTGSGDDNMAVRNSTIHSRLDVYAGSGNDIAFFDGATVDRPAWLWMNGGNDSVQVQGASVFRKRLWHGGIQGHDSIEVAASAYISKLKRLGKIGTQVDDTLIATRITDPTTGAIAKAAAVQAIFNPTLTVSVAADSIVENAGTMATTLTITRSGSTATAVDVTLASSDTSRATVPATVTIPAGSASVTADVAAIDNTTVDPNAVVTFTGTATGFNSGTDTLTVTSEDVATLTVTVDPVTVAESAGSGAATFTVSRNTTDNSQPLTVNLSSSLPGRLTVGTSVEIPANATSATFVGAAVDNALADGDVEVTVSATATDFSGGQVVVTVTNDDAAALTVTSSLDTVAENAGVGAVTYTVSRNSGDLSQPLTVDLSSDTSSRLTVPATVTIPADSSSVTFVGDPVDNSVADGPVQVVVTAMAAGFVDGTKTVTVTDDESPSLTLAASVSSVAENAGNNTVTYTITRNSADLSQELVVALSSDKPARMTVPDSVAIAAGDASATFFGSPVNNTTFDGNADVTVTATATGFNSGDTVVTVIEDEPVPPPSLTASTSSGTVSEAAAPGTVTLTVTRLNSDNSQPLTVSITPSDGTRLSAPATVTIPAAAASAIVDLSMIDNLAVDGPLLETIEVTATGFVAGQTNLTITDNENATLTLTLQSSAVDETIGTLPGTVSTDVTSSADIVVNLEYSDSLVLTGPESVVIPAGQSGIPVDFTVSRNSTAGPDVEAAVRATAIGASASVASVTVSDVDTLSLTTDISANTFEQSSGTVITRDSAFNIKGVTAPGAAVSVDSNGDGVYDDATTTAAADGTYSVDVTLVHDSVNDGENYIVVKADSGTDSADAAVDAHLAVGTVVRFETNLGTWDTELLDADAPITVQNFLAYASSTAYDNLIVHRDIPGFVVQAGGFTVSSGQVKAVTALSPIQNEFNAANSNLRGTLSMAQLNGLPNSGTSQWFFSTVDNSDLDNAKHTVFGRVIGNGMAVVDQINNVTARNLNSLYGSTALSNVPLLQFNPANTPLTGTGSITTGIDVLTGTGTLFTLELQAGQSIIVGTRMYFVESIESNTSLTLSAPAPATDSSLNMLKDVVPNDSDFIVFSNIGEILAVI